MFTALLFISGLTASIASTIIKDAGLKSVKDLSSLSESKVGTINSTSKVSYWRKRFLRDIVKFEDIDSGLQALEDDLIEAFIYDEPILKYRESERGSEEVDIIPIRFDQQLYAFGISNKNSELEKQISERILHYTSCLEWKALLVEYDISLD